MWRHVTPGQPQDPASSSPGSGFKCCAVTVPRLGRSLPRGQCSQSREQGPHQGAESEVPRAQNLGMPDSQALTLYLCSPKKDIFLNSAARVPCLVTLVPAQALNPDFTQLIPFGYPLAKQ